MTLTKYKSKRKFDETPEPKGKKGSTEDKHIFVVQRHHASHLHYDFRLELGGTLKSWAVPKGPSLNPEDKRLAMMVEDHPVDYATFEGDIPAGNYGAGHVDVWDHGTYMPIDEHAQVITAKEFAADLKAGNIKFRMKGKKLKGDFALVNMKKDEKSWLLIKHRDKYAIDEAYNSEDYAKKSSLAYTAERNKAKTVKKVKAVLTGEGEKHKQSVKKSVARKVQIAPGRDNVKLKNFVKPMLAKLHDKPFDSEDWIFEIKWDGYRAIAEVGRKGNRLYSRNGLSFGEAYPSVYSELSKIKKDAIVDGEIVALDKNGKPSFQLLQQYAENPGVPVCYYVFDCLSVSGKSVEAKPLLERKKLLRDMLPASDIVRYCDHITGAGRAFFKLLQQQQLEGMVAKRADSVYMEGKRSGDWLKVKNIVMEEAVIAGYTAARGGRKYFGALVLGVYKKERLVYIGHTGTGFSDAALKKVYDQLQVLKTSESPFGNSSIKVNAPVTWVKPKLVCHLKYTEITADGHRRHPVFMGLRTDKDARDVQEEEAG